MAGLLDALNSDEGMQALGLLAAAGPSATPMSFGQRLFGAMQQDQARRTEAEDRKMRQQMQQMQMQQLREAAAGRKKAAEQEQQRASYLGAIDSSQGPPMQMSVPRALASGLSLPEIGALMPKQEDPMAGIDKVSPKDYTPESLALFVQTRNPAVLRAAPKDQGPDEFERALRLAGIDPASPQGRQMAAARAQKMATHQPGVSVSYGQPVAGVDASGNPVFFQPAKGGGAPAIVPGVKPAPQNRDTKLPAELQRMQIAGDSMVQLMDDYEGLLKKHNPRDPMVQMNPTIRADMQSLKRNIELQFKELQALGALAGPDIEIIRQSLSDPFSVSGAYYGRDGLLSQVKRSRDLVRIRAQAVQSSQGKPPTANAQNGGLPSAADIAAELARRESKGQ